MLYGLRIAGTCKYIVKVKLRSLLWISAPPVLLNLWLALLNVAIAKRIAKQIAKSLCLLARHLPPLHLLHFRRISGRREKTGLALKTNNSVNTGLPFRKNPSLATNKKITLFGNECTPTSSMPFRARNATRQAFQTVCARFK